MGFNTNEHTPFLPAGTAVSQTLVHIIQVGRTIRICEIQLLERQQQRTTPPTFALLFYAASCFQSAHTWNLSPCPMFSFFSSTSHVEYHINYLLLYLLFITAISLLECKCREQVSLLCSLKYSQQHRTAFALQQTSSHFRVKKSKKADYKARYKILGFLFIKIPT